MKRFGLIVGAVVVMAVAGGSYWFATAPTRTLEQIHAAAKDRDVATLERLIDFRSFKTSVRLLISDVAEEASAGQKKPFAAITRVVVDAMANSFVEAAVTPEAIVAMFSGYLPSVKRSIAAKGPVAEPRPIEMSTTWTNLSAARVRVQREGEPNASLAFVMRRDGMTWRLSGVEK